MRHRRRRGLRAAWNWATRGQLVATDNAEPGTVFGISDPYFFPAARTDWMLENARGREHFTIKTILLWLDLAVFNSDSVNDQHLSPQMDFGIIKGYDDGSTETPALSSVARPFQQPQVPSLVASWATGAVDENDGLDPYLWTHTLSPQLFLRSFGTANGYAPIISKETTVSGEVVNGSPLAVRAGWQPDVVIKTNRVMRKRENLTLQMTLEALNTNLQYSLNYSARFLTT